MFAQNLVVFIITLPGLLEILQELRSIFVGNMVKRSTNVKNAPKFMLFNLIGKRTLKPVVLESIGVTVVPFFPGKIASSLIEHFVMH